ncbi:hypothetical protein BDA99DRAFT_161478 [Phascolomyces articulosus]|uniref:Uncharacterized protein n=1 Tax=Phascolomyces articulosus TaxID=60185 RepID=A0AAD5JUR0_9FUNG|nr:hypothetical protein BDA99DRAFT_161478 [Phascolomyces articulosus]
MNISNNKRQQIFILTTNTMKPFLSFFAYLFFFFFFDIYNIPQSNFFSLFSFEITIKKPTQIPTFHFLSYFKNINFEQLYVFYSFVGYTELSFGFFFLYK